MSDLAGLRADLATFGQRLGSSPDLQHAIGKAGKDAALEVAQQALGFDRRFSGLKRNAPLSAGYDLGEPVILNLRPAGLWFLADEGRKRRGRINPKRTRTRLGQRAAVRTPQGIRHHSTYGPTRGKQVLVKLTTRLEEDVPKAVERAIDKIAGELIG